MPNCSESLGSGRAARCAVCDGKFGLVRHYSWRSQLCSKKCVDRFRARRASDRNWLPWLQIALDQAPENRAGALYEALAYDYQQRAEKASRVDAAKSD
jgi:hypothetical protein